MCLAVPVRVVELLEDNQAVVDIGGVKSRVSTALVESVDVKPNARWPCFAKLRTTWQAVPKPRPGKSREGDTDAIRQ